MERSTRGNSNRTDGARNGGRRLVCRQRPQCHTPGCDRRHGIANLAEMMVAAAISTGKLVPLLRNWEPRMSGLFLYYSSRRQVPAPLQAFIAFMRRHKNAVRSGQIAQPGPADDQMISSQPHSAPTRPDLSLV